jgi:phosphorylcholine metabolism protein LicD
MRTISMNSIFKIDRRQSGSSRLNALESAEVIFDVHEGRLRFAAALYLPEITPDEIQGAFCFRAVALDGRQEGRKAFEFDSKAVFKVASNDIVAELSLHPDDLVSYCLANGLVEVSGSLKLVYGDCNFEIPLLPSSGFGRESSFSLKVGGGRCVIKTSNLGFGVLLKLGTPDAWMRVKAKNTIERFEWIDGAACFWGRLEHPIAGISGLVLGLAEKGASNPDILVNATVENQQEGVVFWFLKLNPIAVYSSYQFSHLLFDAVLVLDGVVQRMNFGWRRPKGTMRLFKAVEPRAGGYRFIPTEDKERSIGFNRKPLPRANAVGDPLWQPDKLSKIEYAPDARVPKDWQNALLRLLATLDFVCKENDIEYRVCFGGLLGAVRHHGFIPWDNDIDVVMTEQNYKKLQELEASNRLPAGMRFIDEASEEGYPLLFGRFLDERTSCPLKTSSFNGGANGLFIDVFIMFPLPSDPVEQEDEINDFIVWEQLHDTLHCRNKRRTPLFAKRWREVLSIEEKKGRDAALDYIEKRFRSHFPKGEVEYCFHGSGGARKGFGVFHTDWFKEKIELSFGEYSFDCPAGYLEFFQSRYGGSWREFPAGEKYQAYSCADLNIPGSVVVGDYMQFIDRDQAIADLKAYRDAAMETTVLSAEYYPRVRKIQAQVLAGEINGRYKNSYRLCVKPADGGYHIDARAIVALDGNISEVWQHQLLKEYTYWDVVLPVDADLMLASLWAHFLATQDYGTVRKVFDIQRVRKDFVKNDSARFLNEALGVAYDLNIGIDRDDREAIEKACAWFSRELPGCIQHAIASAWLACSNDFVREEEASAICSNNDIYKSDYLHFYAGVALYKSGDAQRGSTVLDSFYCSTNNGMLLTAADAFAKANGIALSKRVVSSPPKCGMPFKGIGVGADAGASRALSHLREARLLRKKKALLDLAREKEERLKAKVDGYNDLKRLTSDRFAAWERMYPRKPLVVAAAKAGRYDIVRKNSRALYEAIYRRYDAEGLGLTIDEDLLQALLPVLEEDRGKDFVDDYLNKIPSEHRAKDIDVYLKECGVDHPYFRAKC